MKVVLFCVGMGTRLREFSESIPKPMVNIGYRPILWHLMKYYAYYGHNDFILCLGYRADYIKNYFLNYEESLSNDFILSQGGNKIELLNSDIQDWKITFVDTGLTSNIGQRLMAVKEHLDGEEIFLANYSDGLSNIPLPDYIEYFKQRPKIASFASVKPTQCFHLVSFDNTGTVDAIEHIGTANVWINGGFFIFRHAIFDYIKSGEDLITEPFYRLIEQRQLITYRYDGFWACMDRFKDKQRLEDMYQSGQVPWKVWQ